MPRSVKSSASSASTSSSGGAPRPKPGTGFNYVKRKDRFDRFTGNPEYNLFQPEIMGALRSRGGAVWLREVESKNVDNWKEHIGVEKHTLYNRVKNLGNDGFQGDLNILFDIRNTREKLNKTLINRLTLALENLATKDHANSVQMGRGTAGRRSLDFTQFTEGCYQCGLNWLGPENMKRMFERCDANTDGTIDFDEWVNILTNHQASSPAVDQPRDRVLSDNTGNGGGSGVVGILSGGGIPSGVDIPSSASNDTGANQNQTATIAPSEFVTKQPTKQYLGNSQSFTQAPSMVGKKAPSPSDQSTAYPYSPADLEIAEEINIQ